MTTEATTTESPAPKGCLICGETKKALRRGLCTTHYYRFTRAVEKLTDKDRVEVEQMLIERGCLLATRARGARTDNDVFAETVAEYKIQHKKQG